MNYNPSLKGGDSVPISHTSLARLDECDKGNVERLQVQLQRKDSQLTESRLEALSSAHQLHTLRETVASLRGEMTRLKAGVNILRGNAGGENKLFCSENCL